MIARNVVPIGLIIGFLHTISLYTMAILREYLLFPSKHAPSPVQLHASLSYISQFRASKHQVSTYCIDKFVKAILKLAEAEDYLLLIPHRA